ncbi:hypothetical protein BGY98DRAFT_981329 [Russula aff. rugulosa BPL654]|nr:hypothetical protein BGY98DRAFT_981329 [Russula aff. rugulosa BPL654]
MVGPRRQRYIFITCPPNGPARRATTVGIYLSYSVLNTHTSRYTHTWVTRPQAPERPRTNLKWTCGKEHKKSLQASQTCQLHPNTRTTFNLKAVLVCFFYYKFHLHTHIKVIICNIQILKKRGGNGEREKKKSLLSWPLETFLPLRPDLRITLLYARRSCT